MTFVAAYVPHWLIRLLDRDLLQIIDLSMPDLAPEGWSTEAFPPQLTPTDISVCELHIRDFSASDATVPEHLRGKYSAFALVCLSPMH